MLSEDGVNCKYNSGQDYKGKCVSCEKIAKEDVQETAYRVNNENVRNVSVLLVLPDGNQRLITFEVPIALDEYNILEAVKTQIHETKDCHLDMYTVIDENYDFDYIVESRTINRNNESDTNIVINNKSLVNTDSCTSVESNHSNNSKTLSNVSDGLINSSPIAEHKFSLIGCYGTCSSVQMERSLKFVLKVTKYSNEISSDASICGSELERIDIKINVGNGIKVQVGIESKEEKSVDMEGTCVDEITMEETCSQEINILVRTDTDGTQTTTQTLTTESSDTSNSTSNIEVITDIKKVINLEDSPLSDKNTSREEHAESSKINILIIYPTLPAKGGIAINTEDLKCLGANEFLNDSVIDFYLKYLMHEVLSEHDRRRTYVFSSHFYTRLAKPYSSTNSSNVEGVSMCRQRYAGVQRWTKNINIFEKDFVVVPINEHAHWFVAIICFPRMVVNTLQLHNEDSHNEEIKKPCILIFDSLYGTRTSQVAKILKGYLYYEYISKMRKCKSFSKNFLPTAYPIVPKQSNVTDCGLFLLQYVETFFKDPIRNFTLPLRDLKDWFHPIVIRRKRKEIVVLIGRLAKDFHKDENFELPDIVVDDYKVGKSTFNDDNKYTLSSKTLYKLKNIKSQPKNINVKSFYNLKINHSSSEKNEKPISMIKSNRLLVEDRDNSSYADKKNNSLLFSHPAGMMSPPSEKVLNLIKSSVKQNKKSSIKEWLNSNKFEKTGTSSSNSYSSLSFEALKNDIKISPRTSYSDFLKAKRKFQEAEKRNYDSPD